LRHNIIWKLIVAATALGACTASSPAAIVRQTISPATATVQQGGGKPYELLGTQVWDVPDPVSHRSYQVFVSLPADYGREPQRRYPVLYVTDGDYAFPLVKQISHRLNGEGAKIKDFILVGLSYAKGDDPMTSRRRDYTPNAKGPKDAPLQAVFGGGLAYQAYLRDQAIPFIAKHFRTDERSRFYYGHSNGGLLGAEILVSEPNMFRGYILGSPSLWYGDHEIFKMEQAYALHHHDLSGSVYLYIGDSEDTHPGDARFKNMYNMVTDEKTFMTTLSQRHYPSLHVEAEVLNDEDHLSVAPRGATHGLERFLAVEQNSAAGS
jgi:predicted alpha/beta superfamily hydrolase